MQPSNRLAERLHLGSGVAATAGDERQPLSKATVGHGVSSFEVEGSEVVVKKVNRHLLPLFFTVAMLCYLDRSNLAFASAPFLADLGLSKATYGLGAGIFFIAYGVFQVPSNLILSRIGAPTHLAALCVAWGVVASCTAAVSSKAEFLLLRFLLGVAECGAFPGIWYHCSLFYTDGELGLAYTLVTTATALSQVFGGPLAAVLLLLDGQGGLKGWQWLFLLEGIPTILLGCYVKVYLAEDPASLRSLSAGERAWLVRRQEALRTGGGGQGAAGAAGPSAPASSWDTVKGTLTNWRVWYLGLVWLLVEVTIYGIIFWVPLLINAALDGEFDTVDKAKGNQRSEHHSSWQTSKVALISALLFAPAAIAMVLNAQRFKAVGNRRKHAAYPVAAAAIALTLLPVLLKLAGPAAAFCCLIIAACGAWAIHGPFMSWPATFLHGPAAAAGFALINTLGAVGGFVGPFLIGELAELPGGYALAMLVLALLLAIAVALIMAFPEAPGAVAGPLAGGTPGGGSGAGQDEEEGQRILPVDGLSSSACLPDTSPAKLLDGTPAELHQLRQDSSESPHSHLLADDCRPANQAGEAGLVCTTTR